MATSPIICENIWHVYPGDVLALKETSLEVKAGEVLGIVGQNGSGKTTLVKHFNGLLMPTEGRVIVNGLETHQHSVHTLSQHVGYVFQNPNHQLFATKVRTELAFGPKNVELPPDEIEARVQHATEFFDLEPLLDNHPYRLSFPLRKIVAMASIYAMQPQSLFWMSLLPDKTTKGPTWSVNWSTGYDRMVVRSSSSHTIWL